MNDNTLLEQAIAQLGTLIAFPTESSESNLQLIDYIVDIAGSCNAQVNLSYDRDKNKANALLTLPAYDGSTNGGILLSGHTDVVPVAGQNWSSNPFAMERRDGKLYGRGSCDMKGFIATCLVMMKDFANIDRREPLHFAWSYDEEIGCLGARVLIEQMRSLKLVPRIAIIGEPTDMQVIEGHKGIHEYSTEFTGLAGHGSLPDNAVSAIEYAVLYAHKLLGLRECMKESVPSESRFEPPQTTIQIGKFHGGIASNVIADHCALEWEMRPVQPSDVDYVHQHIDGYAEELLSRMRVIYPDSSITRSTRGEVEGLTPMPDVQARDLLCQLTGNVDVGVVSYGTEAGLFQSLGASCVVCGPGSIRQAHKADEYVAIDQLESCLQMLQKLKEKIRL